MSKKKPNNVRDFIDLCAPKGKTSFLNYQLIQFQNYFYLDDKSFEWEDEFTSILDRLERDRSDESIYLLKKLALHGDHQLLASCGIGSLARSGISAIPEILELLLHENSKRAYFMLQAIFSPSGLINYYDVEEENLRLFKDKIRKHFDWPNILLHLQSIKKDAWSEIKEIIEFEIDHYQFKVLNN